MRPYAVFFLVFLCYTYSHAGFELTEGGARAGALGGAAVALSGHVWSLVFNPAGLARLPVPEISFYYSPQPFGLPELKHGMAAVALPTRAGTFGIGGRQYGFSLYKETSLSLSYAHEISGIAAGVSMHYHSVTIARYGSSGTLGFDAGVIVPILPYLYWGIAARNFNAPTIGVSREPIARMFSVGVHYLPLADLGLTVDYLKEIGFPGSPRFGIEYWLLGMVALRAGAADEPSTFTAGAGIRYKMFQLDYALQTHQLLGASHQMSLTLRWE